MVANQEYMNELYDLEEASTPLAAANQKELLNKAKTKKKSVKTTKDE